MNIKDFAYGVLMEALPSIPADVLEGHLATLPEGPHRRVGADAVARLRHLKTA
ncbi:hypothetical protein ACFVDI_16255 [Nocardioides sp. NPDC057767]|uniref:hypothetical protein n=1 Tax=unclassified Nocardioides TaxID=2615069 RepID=UPI0036718FF7